MRALQVAALSDPDPFRRAGYLALLDHIANDASTDVFATALRDPVAGVRRHAVHGLTCERCRSTEVCVTDVVPAVIAALADEPAAEIRHQLVVVLGQFVTRSEVARRTLQEVATSDPDRLLRQAATAVLTNGHTRSRKALERLERSATRRSVDLR